MQNNLTKEETFKLIQTIQRENAWSLPQDFCTPESLTQSTTQTGIAVEGWTETVEAYNAVLEKAKQLSRSCFTALQERDQYWNELTAVSQARRGALQERDQYEAELQRCQTLYNETAA